MKTKKKKFVETFVRKPAKKPVKVEVKKPVKVEPVKVEEKKPAEVKPKPVVAPLCDCGQEALPNQPQCWSCSHRV